jgi:hypothetical protein
MDEVKMSWFIFPVFLPGLLVDLSLDSRLESFDCFFKVYKPLITCKKYVPEDVCWVFLN